MMNMFDQIFCWCKSVDFHQFIPEGLFENRENEHDCYRIYICAHGMCTPLYYLEEYYFCSVGNPVVFSQSKFQLNEGYRLQIFVHISNMNRVGSPGVLWHTESFPFTW